MLRRIRSRISKRPTLDLPTFILNRSRLPFLARRQIQSTPTPVQQIIVQPAVPDPPRDIESVGQVEIPEDEIGDGGNRHDMGEPAQLLEYELVEFGDMHGERHGSPPEQLEVEFLREIPGVENGVFQGECNLASEENQGNEEGADAVENQPNLELPFSPNYLQTHFEIMYLLGLSPIRGDGSNGSRAQLVAFQLITVLALCHFTLQLKQFIVDNVEVGKLDHYVTIWYFMSSLIIQIYILKLFAFDCKPISDILKSSSVDEDEEIFKKSDRKFAKETVISAGIILLSSFVVAIRVDWIFEGYTVEEITLARSFDISRYLFTWTKDANKTAELMKNYQGELTPTTFLMGSFGLLLQFVGNLKGNLIQDILLMSTLHTYRLSEGFEVAVRRILRQPISDTEQLDLLRTTHEDVLAMMNVIEDGFRHFFKCVHIGNWLTCSYFLFDLLIGNFANVYFIVGFIYIPKILLTYVVSAQAVGKSQMTRHLIEKKFDKSKSGEVTKSGVLLFLKILEEHPIGIGHGQFQLNESFASSFVCVVFSCFMLFADSDKDKTCLSE